MEDKTFQLLEKMYSEFIELKNEVKEVKNEVKEVKIEVKEIKQEVKQLGAKIDGDITPKIEALFDGYTQNTEKIIQLEDKIDEVQLSVNELSIKTTNNNSRIIELKKDMKHKFI